MFCTGGAGIRPVSFCTLARPSSLQIFRINRDLRNKQVPWANSSLLGEVYLAEKCVAPSGPRALSRHFTATVTRSR